MNKPSMPRVKWLEDFNPATASAEFKDFLAIQTEEDFEAVGIKTRKPWYRRAFNYMLQWFKYTGCL